MNHLGRQGMIVGLVLLGAPVFAEDAGTPAAIANPLAVWSLDRLSATRERPLFAPTRRPRPPPAPSVALQVEPPPPAPPPTLVVLGIVSDVDGARAMVRTQASDKVIRARLGDDIGGWKVTEIEPRRVTLSHDERSVSYALFARMNAGTRPPAAPPSEPPVQNVAQEREDRRSRR
jgi:general secretion pathway protein N